MITHRFFQRLKLGASVREHAVNRKQGSVGKGCLAIPQAMGGLPEMVMTERHRRTGAAVYVAVQLEDSIRGTRLAVSSVLS